MTANSPDSITLEWYRSPANDATGYVVYTSDSADGTFTKFATVAERTAMHEKLAPGSTHYYKVAATNARGEGPQSAAAMGFTIAPWEPKPFPAKIAGNMCLTLGAEVVSKDIPLSGKLSNFTDGSDATSCRLRRDTEVRIRLNPGIAIADADYLILHYRTDCAKVDWSNDRFSRTLTSYIITESLDSTNGEDGTWQDLANGTNALLDSVVVLPNHQPKWIGVKIVNTFKEKPAANDRRLNPTDLILARLEVFRSAPAGFRNDYWIFTGDSLVVGDMPASSDPERTALFSDLVRKQHPDRYPIVVHAGRGGEMMKDTLPRTKRALESLSPPQTSGPPVATMLCWESGFNDVGVGASLGLGTRLLKSLGEAKEMCDGLGLFMVPVRIEYSTSYLDPETLEPKKYNVFVNSLAVNLAGVDVFGRTQTPYACDPQTQRPYADYWSFTRKNYATALVKDGVHHTSEGMDGINRLWADVADRMIYTPQK
jgi:hypothetical protein